MVNENNNKLEKDNNDIKEMMMLSLYNYKPILESKSAYDIAATSLREAAFNIVLGNTASRKNISPERINFFREEFEEFVSAEEITISDSYHGDKVCHVWKLSPFKYTWDFAEWAKSMSNLVSYLTETQAWYEDTTNTGFCYKGRNGHHYVVSHK